MKPISYCSLCLLALLTGCADDIPTVSLGLDDTYIIARMQKLPLTPALTGSGYEWRVNGEVVSHSRDYVFITDTEGLYQLSFEITDENKSPYQFDFTVRVVHEEVEYSPYIARVLDYCPAPGQFVNEMPMYEPGDTYADMLQKVEESISGTNNELISLGGYGGYVTFAFDHTVMNVPGQKDFRIWGNAFYEQSAPGGKGGSSEPGIVMVSFDANCNGVPDDPWYELAGSEYRKPETIRNYSITYSRTDPDAADISWTDSEGSTGRVDVNPFRPHDYWPSWVNADKLTYSGTLLKSNAVDTGSNGLHNYVLYAYDWGYVDNHPNELADLNSFDISWAVDSAGNEVNLPGADFIRVYTGMHQYCGSLGESSTELSHAQDLHL